MEDGIIKQETDMDEKVEANVKIEPEPATEDAAAVKPEFAAEVKAEDDRAADNGVETVSDEDIRSRLLNMLEESDLAKVTEKMLRKQLEEQLGMKLADKKQLIRAEVLSFLAKQQGDQDGGEQEEEEQQEEEAADDEPDEGQEKTKKKRGWGAVQYVLSEPLAALVGSTTMSRSDVVKKIWEYIKANELQNPKDKRQIIVDEKLGTVFTHPLTMFSMNKQLTKHIKNKADVVGPSDNEAASADEDEEEQPKKKQRTSTAKSKAAADSAATSAKKPSGFTKPLKISDELAAATGEPEMSRGAVVKWMYAYVKENNLYDPKDKRYVIADETLKNLTGVSRFLAFSASKLFSKHFPSSKK